MLQHQQPWMYKQHDGGINFNVGSSLSRYPFRHNASRCSQPESNWRFGICRWAFHLYPICFFPFTPLCLVACTKFHNHRCISIVCVCESTEQQKKNNDNCWLLKYILCISHTKIMVHIARSCTEQHHPKSVCWFTFFSNSTQWTLFHSETLIFVCPEFWKEKAVGPLECAAQNNLAK